MNKRKVLTNESSRYKILFAFLLAIAVALYNMIWLNKSLVMAVGWDKVYIELMNRGKVPYRDFYYFLPPLNLVIDWVIWKLSGDYFILYRFWRLLERIIIVELMYRTLTRRFDAYLSVLIAFLGGIIASANVHDLIGDYNQSLVLILVIFGFLVKKYIDSLSSKPRYMFIFLAGLGGGTLVLAKQTIAASAAIVFTVIFVLLAIKKIEKHLFKVIGLVVSGVLIPIVIACGVLYYFDALTPFIEQVFINVGSKGGSPFDIVFGTQFGVLKHNISFVILAVSILGIVFLRRKEHIVNRKVFIAILTSLGVYFGYSVLFEEIRPLKGLSLWIGLVMMVLIIGISFIKTEWIRRLTYISSMVVIGILFYLDVIGIATSINSEWQLFDSITRFMTYIYISVFGYLIYSLIKCKPSNLDSEVVVLSGCAVAHGWATIMSSGTDEVTSICAFLLIPAFMMIVFKRSSKKYIEPVLFPILLLVFVTCISQKVICSYSWWGDSEAPIKQKTETSVIPALKGFKFSVEEKKKYDELYKVILAYSDDNTVIWGFPYVEAYNCFLNNYNMDTFVPVVFYDVCADSYAEEEAERLESNPPGIVVWLDIPGCLELHEDAFRGGERAGQRKIVEWFSSVKDENYCLVGQVENVYVYKYTIEEEVPEYKFIEGRLLEPCTIGIFDEDYSKIDLLGEGTQKEPFLITSLSDLQHFRDLVNKGYTFANKYVKQTTDIDLQLEDWEPIGIYDSSKYFYGLYDGDGYSIRNLRIDSPDTNSGFFGILGGKVINTEFLSCDVSSNCGGIIASHGTGCPVIANCVVTGSIVGYRVAGIADNMGGNLINCVSYSSVDGVQPSGISGYYTNSVTNCFSSMGNNISPDDGEPIDEATLSSLNAKISDIEENCDFGFDIKLCEWTLEDGRLSLVENPG